MKNLKLKLESTNVSLLEPVKEEAYYLDMFIIPNDKFTYSKEFVDETLKLDVESLEGNKSVEWKMQWLAYEISPFANHFRNADGSVSLVDIWVSQNLDYAGEEINRDINLSAHDGEGRVIHSKDGKKTLHPLLQKVFCNNGTVHTKFCGFIPQAWIEGVSEGNYIHLVVDTDEETEFYKDIYICCRQRSHRYNYGDFENILNKLGEEVRG